MILHLFLSVVFHDKSTITNMKSTAEFNMIMLFVSVCPTTFPFYLFSLHIKIKIQKLDKIECSVTPTTETPVQFAISVKLTGEHFSPSQILIIINIQLEHFYGRLKFQDYKWEVKPPIWGWLVFHRPFDDGFAVNMSGKRSKARWFQYEVFLPLCVIFVWSDPFIS